MIESLLAILLSLAFVSYVGWAVNKALTTPFEWEDDFWKAIIEADLNETRGT